MAKKLQNTLVLEVETRNSSSSLLVSMCDSSLVSYRNLKTTIPLARTKGYLEEKKQLKCENQFDTSQNSIDSLNP